MRGVRCWLKRFPFLIMMLFAPPVSAQEPGRGVLALSTEDELGGMLVGAKVTLIEVETQRTRELATDERGQGAFEGLTPGNYVMTVTSPGFRTLERRLAVGTERPRPLKLQLQVEVSETVDVSETRRPQIQRARTEENGDAIPVDDDLLAGVPLGFGKDRMVEYLSHFLSPIVGTPTIVVDGQEVSGLSLPAKAIAGLVINRNPYSAEYRRPGKSKIEVMSQDGSKTHYHFDASVLLGDSALNARNAFAEEKPDLQQRLGEMQFGGPLQSWKGSYLLSGSAGDDRTTSIVNAVTETGAPRTLVPGRLSERFFRGRFDLGTRSDRLQYSFKYDYESGRDRSRGVGGLALPELAYDKDETTQSVRFGVHSIVSPSLVNDTRLSMVRPVETVGNQASGPMIVVNGAFRGGANQKFSRSRAVEAEIQDAATYFRGAHTIRFGGRFRPQFATTTDASNFGGTFEFANLERFNARQPFVFRVNQGTPQLEYGPHVADAFFQDEIKLRPALSLMLGARYDFESYIGDHNNVAPRVAFAFAPGTQKTNVRGGVGVFYDRLGDSAIEQALLFDGARTRTLVFTNPSFPNPFAAGPGIVATPSRYELAPDLSAGYLVHSNISIEHQIWRRTMVSVDLSHVRGVDLFRVRDLNAPLPGTSLRPDPTVREIIQIESTGAMRSNSVQVTFNRKGVAFDGAAVYTYARTDNDTPGASAGGSLASALPANNYDPGAEWGRADFDVRHRFSLTGLLSLTHGFHVGSILELKSGKPYEVTTGFDDNGDTRATDRPAGFQRNAGQAPGFARLDLRLKKLFETPRPLKRRVTDESGELELSIDAFNVLNRVNYREIVGVRSSPFFGRPISAESARAIQFAITYSF
jgi:hypothetical protein